MYRVAVCVVLALTAVAVLAVGSAPAAPLPGTTPVSPSSTACGRPAVVDHVRCGASFTARWLAYRGVPDVVVRTVIAAPGAVGAWRSSTTGGLCGYTDVGSARFGMHHCDRTTFVVPSLDGDILRSDVTTITALAHESGHGVQERRGLDPVATTLSGDGRRLFPLEQHADCWAGAAVRWYISTSMLPPSARESARGLLWQLGSPDDVGHGTPDQRRSAFDAGYANGANFCLRWLRPPAG